MSRVLPLLLVLAVLSLFLACSDDPAQPGGGVEHVLNSVSGQLTVTGNSAPVVGARVAMVNPLPYRVVAGPVISDDTGHFEFKNPPLGDWYLFVFSDSLLMFDTDDARVTVRRGQRIKHDIAMIKSDLWGNNPQRVVGTVTDAQTGAPIEGAFVSGFAFAVWHSFVGISIDVEDVTDADGRYSVVPASVFGNPGSAQLGISREGYQPFYMLDVPVPMDPDSLLVLDIALERLDGGASARGRILDPNGHPVAGLPVALDYSTIPVNLPPAKGETDPQRVPLLGKTVRTNAQGFFEFTELSPGTYYVDAGFLPDDGFVGGGDDPLFEITDEGIVGVGDLHVIPAMAPLSPANGSTVTDPRPILRWQAVAGTDHYQVSTGAGHFLSSIANVSGTTQYQFPEDLEPGTHMRWIVSAYRMVDTDYGPLPELIGSFETVQAFVVKD
jgi:hypothetical protein